MASDWTKLCERFLDLRRRPVRPPGDPALEQELEELADLKLRVVDLAAELAQTEMEWFSHALLDPERKWFVQFVFDSPIRLPEAMVPDMIRAAVYELNPSFNRDFIEPALAFAGVDRTGFMPVYEERGIRRVNERLFEYIRSGSELEVYGACSVLYWVPPGTAYQADETESTTSSMPEDLPIKAIETETAGPFPELQDLAEERTRLFLKTFIAYNDAAIQCAIISQLSHDYKQYPPDLQLDILKVLDIAKHHSDETIRSRVEGP